MAVYRFRVFFEDDEDIYRDIDIKSNQTFADLHQAIQQAIKFDDSQLAAFYHTDSNWRKDAEIVQIDKKQDSKSKKIKLASFVEDPHQRFLYLFDFKEKWLLYIEMIKILQEAPGADYPKCSKTNGVAPLQYKPVLTPAMQNAEEDEDGDEEPEPTTEELVYESDSEDSLVEEVGEKEKGENEEESEGGDEDNNEEGQEDEGHGYENEEDH